MFKNEEKWIQAGGGGEGENFSINVM